MKNKATSFGIIVWIFCLTLSVLLIIIIGGITRLTDSGLSMVDWRPILGTIPPLSNQDWINVFEKYKQTPEFLIVNKNIVLEDFKFIFWWEWFHRFFARFIGIIFIIPFIYFYLKRKLTIKLVLVLILVFIFGFFQAFIGWWMVKSGLTENPYVSPYRLTFHLGNAIIIFSILFWLLLDLYYGNQINQRASKLIIKFFEFSLIMIFITILSGSFMSGSGAGKSFNTFPLMNGQIIPEGYYINYYGWNNIFENTVAINFNHRWLATFSFLFISLIILYLFLTKKQIDKFPLILVIFFLSLQFFLGVLTLTYNVPIVLASMHQTNSTLLLASLFFAYHRYKYLK